MRARSLLLIVSWLTTGCAAPTARLDGGVEPRDGRTADAPFDATAPSDATASSDAGSSVVGCGYRGQGRVVRVAEDIELCLPPTVCTSETCPPPVGRCVDGACVFEGEYRGLETLPEAWATYYCDLPTGGCHGVTQLRPPEETVDRVAAALALPPCFLAGASDTRCVGVVASPPMMVGNSQEAIDPATGGYVASWGLGMTEASGLCYELRGPGGAAVVAITDRCGGYCRCAGSGLQECGPCVSAPDMAPGCACVGAVPGLHAECCGRGCASVNADCDWCASNNHPHFDVDIATFHRLCGERAADGSCRLAAARPIDCLPADPAWPPGGTATCPEGSFRCPDGAPSPEQPQIPGTTCCCNWGTRPDAEGHCG